jgi:excisionase family DNA binding protein
MLALMDQAEPVVADEAEATIAKDAVRKLKAVVDAKQDVRVHVQDGAKVSVPLPARAVELIYRILESMAERVPISVIPHEAELTTQQAADFLNVSRPFLVGLLENDQINYRMVGTHRRIRYGDLLQYEERSKKERRQAIEEMVAESKRLGLE